MQLINTGQKLEGQILISKWTGGLEIFYSKVLVYLTLIYMAMIKHMSKSNLGKDGIIWIITCSILEKPMKDPKQRPQRNTAYRLVPHGYSQEPHHLSIFILIFGMKFKIIFRVDKLFQTIAHPFSKKYAHVFILLKWLLWNFIDNNTTTTIALFFPLHRPIF